MLSFKVICEIIRTASNVYFGRLEKYKVVDVLYFGYIQYNYYDLTGLFLQINHSKSEHPHY